MEDLSLPLDHEGRVRRVLVTGTSAGIGRAIAQLFCSRGHEVAGIDRAPSTLDLPLYRHVQADVRDAASLDLDFEPEVIVSNAGVQDSGEDIDINLKGTLAVCERFAFADPQTPAPQIRSVVLVGSASGHTGAEFPAYAASKGGILAYAKNLAQRLAPQAVCNSIDPGGVLTDLNRPVMEDAALWSRIMELTPLRRWATPEEIAEWVYFVSMRNRFMTGQNVLIDGGEAGSFDFVWPEG